MNNKEDHRHALHRHVSKSALPSVAGPACCCPQEDTEYTRFRPQRRFLLWLLSFGCMWILFRVTGDDPLRWWWPFLPEFNSRTSNNIKGAAIAVGPGPDQIKNLVTFGDSYTDASQTGDGGVAWPTYAADYGNFTLFPFAKAGATCSNNLTFAPFLSVAEGQIPAYVSQKNSGEINVPPEETIYTIWIGTNDLGANNILSGQQAPGVTVVDTTTCAVNWAKTLYDTGARNFLFQNMIPLQKVPMYQPNAYPNRYWTAARNTTAWSLEMAELVNAGNTMARLMLKELTPTLPGAHVGLFDSYALFSDIIVHPGNYLNGTAPLNVTDAINACVFDVDEPTNGPSFCTTATGTDKDSFLWWDEIHPSEQADRVVAREITDAIKRKSDKWSTWFS